MAGEAGGDASDACVLLVALRFALRFALRPSSPAPPPGSAVNPPATRIEQRASGVPARQEEHDHQPRRLGCGRPRRLPLAPGGDRTRVAGRPAARRADVLVAHDHLGADRRRGRRRTRPNPGAAAARRRLRPEPVAVHLRLHDVGRHLDGAAVPPGRARAGADGARQAAASGEGGQAQGPAGRPVRADHPHRRASRPGSRAWLRPLSGRRRHGQRPDGRPGAPDARGLRRDLRQARPGGLDPHGPAAAVRLRRARQAAGFGRARGTGGDSRAARNRAGRRGGHRLRRVRLGTAGGGLDRAGVPGAAEER